MSKSKPMSKRTRTLILSCVAVLVLGAVLALLLLLPSGEEGSSSLEESSDSTITVLNKTKDADDKTVENPVKAVTIELQGETYSLALDEEGVLVVDQYKELLSHPTNSSSLSSALAGILATSEIGTVDNPADYGLDKPIAKVKATYHDGSSYSFQIGAETPLKDGYYFQAEDGKVYVVESSMADTINQPSTAYIGTTLISAPTVRDDDENGRAVLRDMSLSGTVRADKPFAFQAVTVAEQDKYPYYSYRITSPYAVGADVTKSENVAVYTSLTATKAVVAFPTKEDLATYGLDNPYSVAKLHTAVSSLESSLSESSSSVAEGEDDKTVYYNVSEHTIIVGKADEDGNYYIMVDDHPVIYLTTAASLSPWLDMQYDDLADSQLFLANITDIQSISVTVNGKKTVFELTHHPDEEDSDKNLEVKVGDKTYDTDSFRDLYQVLMSLNRYSAADKKPSGTPQAVITLTRNGEKEPFTTAEFYTYSPSLYTCLKQSGEYYQVKATDIDRLIRQMENYLAGKEVSLR